ncbi:MAG: cardiolipin synthase B [Burkholderiales bacterium]|nr:cardiolipin synthase B [Burkholderiales bacterium]
MPASHPPPENQLKLLVSGADFFPALLRAIEEAKQEVLLETYIFSLDDTANAVKQALVDAAQRGVVVRLITDWHGTGRNAIATLNQAFLPAGVEHRNFNPWFKRGYTRTHRKLCVVDQRIAFVGGINITDDNFCDFDPNLALSTPRWDFAVQLSGPLVHDVWVEISAQWQRIAKLDWQAFLAKQRSLPRIPNLPHWRTLAKFIRGGKAMPLQATFLVRNNFHNRRTIQNAYLKAMGTAQQQIFLVTPYFAPGRKFIAALINAAQRGVEVTLLIGAGQFPLLDAVAHAFYPALLANGVRLVEYRKTQLHAKVAVIDSTWATVGSSNFDGLSLFVNHEANVVVKDGAFANELQGHIQNAVADGISIALSQYQDFPWYKRAGYRLAYWLYKALLSIATRGHYH